jgi:prepilin-type N-terminal cleavage/methylation domain-containing protein
MKTTRTDERGFTIIEMLVVIGIIAVLLGLLLPALSSVQNRARKNTELSHLRQLHFAWMAYANDNNDSALPGYIDEGVQQRWRIRVRFPYDPDQFDENGPGGALGSGITGSLALGGSYASSGPLLRQDLPDSPTDRPTETDQTAATWTWRLLPYLEESFESVLYYDDESDRTTRKLVERRDFVAVHPGFGYNGLYIGGRWHMVADVEGGTPRPQYYFTGATIRDPLADGLGEGTEGRRVNVVARSVSRISRASEVVIFCPSIRIPTPQEVRRIDDVAPGYHMVTPPIVAEEFQWGHTGTDVTSGGVGATTPGGPGAPTTTGADSRFISTFASPALVPLGRYNGLVPILRADGSTSTDRPGALMDQRLWIDAARTRDFRHTSDPNEEDFAEFP